MYIYEREPQPEAAVSFRTVVMFVTWLIGVYSVTNGMTTPEVCVLTDVSFNKFRQRLGAEELGVGGITMCLPTAPT